MGLRYIRLIRQQQMTRMIRRSNTGNLTLTPNVASAALPCGRLTPRSEASVTSATGKPREERHDHLLLGAPAHDPPVESSYLSTKIVAESKGPLW